jgi:hypothetical protein
MDTSKAHEYTELQQKGFELARLHTDLTLQERLNIIAGTFNCKTADIGRSLCTGKWRGYTDLSIKLDNGSSLWIGTYRTPESKKPETVNNSVNSALAKFHPYIVREAKTRAIAALIKREVEDNANSESKGHKPYTFLNVELNDGSNAQSSAYLGWYYVTLAVNDKIFGFVESGLNSDIARGILPEHNIRPDYFVAGGLRDNDVDFIFDNVGHSSFNGSYHIALTNGAGERAVKTLHYRICDENGENIAALHPKLAGLAQAKDSTLNFEDLAAAKDSPSPSNTIQTEPLTETQLLKLDKSYLGFTDDKSPMHKARVENALDKVVRFEGILCSRKDFILNLILRGNKPKELLDSSRYGARSGEKLEPKMMYRMQVDGENCYYEVNKTEHDFALYLLNQNIASEVDANRLIAAERERMACEQRQRDEREQQKQEAEQASKKEKDDFKAWLHELEASYPNQERLDLMKDIFTSMVGSSNPRVDLLVLIENIDKPLCRDKLISRLHTGNKASRKTFECVTGLKLPKTAKDTRTFLLALSSDDYKDSIPFKERRSPSETPKETFYTLMRDGAFEKVMAEPLSKYGMSLFIHQSNNTYKISEAKSGACVASGKTKQAALGELTKLVGRMTAETIEQSVQANIARHGLSPRYQENGGVQTKEDVA